MGQTTTSETGQIRWQQAQGKLHRARRQPADPWASMLLGQLLASETLGLDGSRELVQGVSEDMRTLARKVEKSQDADCRAALRASSALAEEVQWRELADPERTRNWVAGIVESELRARRIMPRTLLRGVLVCVYVACGLNLAWDALSYRSWMYALLALACVIGVREIALKANTYSLGRTDRWSAARGARRAMKRWARYDSEQPRT